MKFHKILAIFLAFLLCFSLSACKADTSTEATIPEPPEAEKYIPDFWEIIEYKHIGYGLGQYLLYDPETLVMYSYIYDRQGSSITMVYNADGTPRLYTPEISSEN